MTYIGYFDTLSTVQSMLNIYPYWSTSIDIPPEEYTWSSVLTLTCHAKIRIVMDILLYKGQVMRRSVFEGSYWNYRIPNSPTGLEK